MANMIDLLTVNRNKRGYPQFQRGYVLKSVDGQTVVNADGSIGGNIKRILFTFSEIVADKFDTTVSGLPGMETQIPTKTIRTARLDIDFVSGDAVDIGGTLWNVRGAEHSFDNRIAQITGEAATGWVLYLEGGKGCGGKYGY